MSDEKQIEEMARNMCLMPCLCDECEEIRIIADKCLAQYYSMTLFKRGYRKQKEGENVSGTPSLFECSACHWRDNDTCTADTSEYNYCPNCGAKMKGGA